MDSSNFSGVAVLIAEILRAKLGMPAQSATKKRKPNFLEICIWDFPKIFREVRGSDSLTNIKFKENFNLPKNV